MSYLTIARFEGDPERLIEGHRRATEIMDQVGRDHGLILHAAAQTSEGMLVMNLWPSKEGSESAAGDPRRLEVLERVGSDVRGMHREHHELDRCVFLADRP